MEDFKPTMKLRWVKDSGIANTPDATLNGSPYKLQQLFTKTKRRYGHGKIVDIENEWRDIEVVEPTESPNSR